MTALPWRLAVNLQAVLTQAAWVGVRLMIGYRALDAGADPVLLGFFAASFAVPALAAALPVGRYSDRFGGAVVVLVGVVIVLAGVLAAAWTFDLLVLLAASVVIGLGHLMAVVGAQTFVAHRTSGGATDGAFGTLTASASIGQFLGPPLVTIGAALGGSASRPDTSVGLLAAGACALAALPFFVVLRRVDHSTRSVRAANRESPSGVGAMLLSAGMWRALLVSGAVLATMDLMYAFVPVWALENRVGVIAVGWLLALRALVSVLSRYSIDRLVRGFGRKALLIIAMSIAVASLALLPFVDGYGAIAVMIGLGIGLGLPQPLTLSWVIGISRSSDLGAALGLRMTANRLAQVTMPIAVSVVAAPLGVAAVFWANAVILACSVAVVAGSQPGPFPETGPLDVIEDHG